MGIIKGQNLRLKIGNNFVAFATSCTLHVSSNLEEASTKDTTGDFQSQELTGLSWDVSTDALYSVTSDSGAMNGEAALGLILAKQKVTVTFMQTESGSEHNRGSITGTTTKYIGQAWVSDISVNAANRQNASYTIQLTGDGPLTSTNATSSGTYF